MTEKDDDILELILKKFRIKFRCEYFRKKLCKKLDVDYLEKRCEFM